MVGRVDRAVNLGLTRANGPASEDPIDNSSVTKEGVGRPCCHVLIRKCVLKPCLADRRGRRSRGHVDVQIARKENGHVRVIAPGILEGLVQLRTAQLVLAAAFEVQVIGDGHIACNTYFDDQGQSSSGPFLKRADFWKEPVRPPEIRLLLKPQDAGVRQGPR